MVHRIHGMADTTSDGDIGRPAEPPEDSAFLPPDERRSAAPGAVGDEPRDDAGAAAPDDDPSEPADETAGPDDETAGPFGDLGVPVVIAPAARPAFPAAVPSREPERGPGMWRTAAVALLAGIVGASVAAAAVWWLLRDEDVAQADRPAMTVVERVETQVVNPEEGVTTASAVARAVLPSIVTVEISETESGDFVADASGSGVVLEANGLLVTNEHVVAGAAAVRVVFADGRIYEAEVIGRDALTDLALLRIEAAGLTPIELRPSDGLEIGDTAIAVGSPLGLSGGPSVTVGVVSAFDRRVRTGIDEELYGMLQTDAPITRGSSGGALVDDRGRLIGITTAIGVSDVGAEGLGFAIPIEMVTRVVDDLRDDGTVEHAFLGITGVTWFEEQADGAEVPSGVVVGTVEDGSAAQAAGLEPGDVILSFDGVDLTTMEQLVVGIRLYRVGDSIDLEVRRDGVPATLTATLGERPEGI